MPTLSSNSLIVARLSSSIIFSISSTFEPGAFRVSRADRVFEGIPPILKPFNPSVYIASARALIHIHDLHLF